MTISNSFVHLHVHSEFSLLDSTASIGDLVGAAKAHGMLSLALTDHGNLFGLIEFYARAIKMGVRPIIGMETYVSPTGRANKSDRNNFHLVLLAMNQTGLRNLMTISSRAFADGFYYRPRVDYELLAAHAEGLIALGGCLQGEVPHHLLHGQDDDATKAARRYQDIFGRDHFYLEAQNHGLADEAAVLPRLIDLGKRLEVPLVATCDCHYVRRQDSEAHDVLLAMQTQTVLSDPNRWRFGSSEFFMKSAPEMAELFANLPDAISNTVRVAEMCDVRIKLGGQSHPRFDVPQGSTSDEFLNALCEQAMPVQFPTKTPDVSQRCQDELAAIRKAGIADVLLVAWDVAAAARRLQIATRPVPGQLDGSVVGYLLQLSGVDPTVSHLSAANSLNPDRIEPPTVTIAVEQGSRDRVLGYLAEKYGADRVAQPVTFVRIGARAAAEVGRVMGRRDDEIRAVSEAIADTDTRPLTSLVGEFSELRNMAKNSDQQIRRWLELAIAIDGRVVRTAVHPSRVVISRDPMAGTVPTFRDKSGAVVTQFDEGASAKAGMLMLNITEGLDRTE